MLRQRGVRNTKVRAMMSTQSRYIIGAGVIAGLLGIPHTSSAQLNQLPYMLKYKTGQNIQPIFQGWSRNPDGSFEMHLGYLNRNYIEELHVPVGPDNNIQPGDQDQGQPTYFYTRAHRSVFSVTVPADFGDQELIWTVTAHGKTQQAVGWLQPEWEIDAVSGGGSRQLGEEAQRNIPPVLSIDAPGPGSVSAGLSLTARVTDDGLPTPRGRRQLQRNRAVGQEVPPILVPPEGTLEPPKNVPGLNVNNRGAQQRARPPEGLSVSYIVWRGPAGVTATPFFAPVEDGAVTLPLGFSQPGTYVLQARVSDGGKSTYEFLTVTVN